jgi:hypothetical protein
MINIYNIFIIENMHYGCDPYRYGGYGCGPYGGYGCGGYGPYGGYYGGYGYPGYLGSPYGPYPYYR